MNANDMFGQGRELISKVFFHKDFAVILNTAGVFDMSADPEDT